MKRIKVSQNLQEIKRILKYDACGVPDRAIADIYNLSRQTINKIINDYKSKFPEIYEQHRKRLDK